MCMWIGIGVHFHKKVFFLLIIDNERIPSLCSDMIIGKIDNMK